VLRRNKNKLAELCSSAQHAHLCSCISVYFMLSCFEQLFLFNGDPFSTNVKILTVLFKIRNIFPEKVIHIFTGLIKTRNVYWLEKDRNVYCFNENREFTLWMCMGRVLLNNNTLPIHLFYQWVSTVHATFTDTHRWELLTQNLTS
jgi:hypothetical protein